MSATLQVPNVAPANIPKGSGSEPVLTRKPLGSVAAVVQSVGAKFLIIGVNAATGIITARSLGASGRGELAAMILWPVLLGSALTLGVPSALTYQLRQRPQQRSQLIGTALAIALLMAVVGIAASFFFLPLWLSKYSPRIVFFARIYLLSMPLTTLLLAGRAALESRGKFTSSNKLLVAAPALTLIWLLILKLTGHLSPVSAAFAYGPVGIPPLWWMWRELREDRPSFGEWKSSAKLLLSYGIRSYGIDLCGTMALYVDQALVVRMLAPGLMGIYVVALSLSRMLNAFHTSVIMVLFPRSVGAAPDQIALMTGRAVRVSTSMTAMAGLFIVWFGPQVLKLLYGAGYSTATQVLRVLVVEVVLAGATLVLSQPFMALGRPGVITFLQITGLSLTIPLMFVLVPRYGILGAGVALLSSTLTRLCGVLVCYPLFLKMPVPRLIPKSDDYAFIGSAISSLSRRNGRVLSATGGAQ